MQIFPTTLARWLAKTVDMAAVSYLQQFTQAPPKFLPITVDTSPFSYTAKEPGFVFVNGGSSQTRVFVYEGDSLTQQGPLEFYVNQTNIFFSEGASFDYATGGDTAANMVGEYATQGHLQVGDVATGPVYFFLDAGTNDIGSFSTPAATIYGYLKQIWGFARTDGYVVVASTVKPCGQWADFGGAQLVIMNDLNALILSDPSQYDYIIRMDLLFPDPNNAILFKPDKTHFTPAGYVVYANAINDVVGIPQSRLNIGPNIELIRGTDTLDMTGQKIVPVSINDIVTATYSILPTMIFIPIYGAAPR